MTDVAISVVPANEASWDDLKTVFGPRGEASRCQCQYFKIRDSEWRSFPSMSAPSGCASRRAAAVQGPARRAASSPRHLRRRKVRRGQQADTQAGRDANRFLGSETAGTVAGLGVVAA
jgi:hypothetical protein